MGLESGTVQPLMQEEPLFELKSVSHSSKRKARSLQLIERLMSGA